MISSRARTGGAVVLIALLGALAGCASFSIGGAPEPTDPPPAETEEPVDEIESLVPRELTFDAGDELEPGSIYAEWTDPFAADDEFAVLSADNGNGGWSYTDLTNECEITFYQGTLSDVDTTGGDQAASIAAISTIVSVSDPQATPELVEQYGTEVGVSQYPDEGTVSMWGLGAEVDDGTSWVNSARYFSAIDRFLLYTVTCPSGESAYDAHDRLIGPIGLSIRVVEEGE